MSGFASGDGPENPNLTTFETAMLVLIALAAAWGFVQVAL